MSTRTITHPSDFSQCIIEDHDGNCPCGAVGTPCENEGDCTCCTGENGGPSSHCVNHATIEITLDESDITLMLCRTCADEYITNGRGYYAHVKEVEHVG